ncbi:uncharacterized protein LOC126895292 [Daktulosphaira vitifoliae]|uniref:uncharacterized protein LOC126895292 n=1 Tax=Daktulosphaira vitifoliae TaxID=58002 RepID=UPI0021AAE6D6|nr:uncharacterized protein LOC126895292 [Daktulosphaira vitifoliae]
MSRTNNSGLKKKIDKLKEFSIADENFEPPQQASTPAKYVRRSSRKALRTLENSNILNISAIRTQEEKKPILVEKPLKPSLEVINEDYEFKHVPELFCSDPENEEESEITEEFTLTKTNESDDKWTTMNSDASDYNFTNITDIMAEIDADIVVRFEKAPRRSYPGRKRNNKSLYEDENENDQQILLKTDKKEKRTKQKKKVDPQEEAFIRSINEHFNDVETFSLTVE